MARGDAGVAERDSAALRAALDRFRTAARGLRSPDPHCDHHDAGRPAPRQLTRIGAAPGSAGQRGVLLSGRAVAHESRPAGGFTRQVVQPGCGDQPGDNEPVAPDQPSLRRPDRTHRTPAAVGAHRLAGACDRVADRAGHTSRHGHRPDIRCALRTARADAARALWWISRRATASRAGPHASHPFPGRSGQPAAALAGWSDPVARGGAGGGIPPDKFPAVH